MTKFLILRFSSIGDIVLTTPVIRCLKQQYKNAEVHYATKVGFKTILENNVYIDKLHLLNDNIGELITDLKAENYDYIIDLHNNLRTRIIKTRLGKPSFAFKKYNVEKFLLTNFKIDKMPSLHIVDRYLDTLKSFNVKNDAKGLDYFIPAKDEVALSEFNLPKEYIGFVIGAKFATKRMPLDKILEVCSKIELPIVLLGGKEDVEVGAAVEKAFTKKVFNAVGKFNLNQSASLVKQAKQIITHDTGLMHIASALQKDIISIWGNTTTKFGMYPYVSTNKFSVIEVNDLKCRPCSKIGYAKCPKSHFKCMNDISVDDIIVALK